jgi:ZIP family zinc transporter
MNISAILITLVSGIAFFIGYLITLFVKDEKKLVTFAVGFSFSIIIGLSFFDLLPECIESLDNKLIMILCMIGGVGLLKILDLFVPEHNHEGHGKHHLESHMEHIGLVSAIALFLHNIIEGTAVYTTALSDLKLGTLMVLGVSFHNIPLGIQVSSLIHNKKEKVLMISFLALSSVVGILLLNVFNIHINEMISGILISITFGMLIYISLFELLCEVKEHFKEKELKLGLLVGVIFILIGHFIH